MSFLGTLLRFHPQYFRLFSEKKRYEEIFRIGNHHTGLIRFNQDIYHDSIEAKSYIEIMHDYQPECYAESFEYTMYKYKGKPTFIQSHFLLRNEETISHQDIPRLLMRDWKLKDNRNIIWKK
jgi:hypothetical protein